MPDVTTVDHPAAALQLAALRDGATRPEAFRVAARRLGMHLAAAALERIPSTPLEITTPLGTAVHHVPAHTIVAVPVLRAGLGLLDGVSDAIPGLRVGMIGLARDEETLEPEQYYRKLPRTDGCWILLLEPMLATGGSAAAAVAELDAPDAAGVTVLSVVATQGAIDRVVAARPGGCGIVTAAIDPGLNEDGYIVPGLGDFGDRLFGTL